MSPLKPWAWSACLSMGVSLPATVAAGPPSGPQDPSQQWVFYLAPPATAPSAATPASFTAQAVAPLAPTSQVFQIRIQQAQPIPGQPEGTPNGPPPQPLQVAAPAIPPPSPAFPSPMPLPAVPIPPAPQGIALIPPPAPQGVTMVPPPPPTSVAVAVPLAPTGNVFLPPPPIFPPQSAGNPSNLSLEQIELLHRQVKQMTATATQALIGRLDAEAAGLKERLAQIGTESGRARALLRDLNAPPPDRSDPAPPAPPVPAPATQAPPAPAPPAPIPPKPESSRISDPDRETLVDTLGFISDREADLGPDLARKRAFLGRLADRLYRQAIKPPNAPLKPEEEQDIRNLIDHFLPIPAHTVFPHGAASRPIRGGDADPIGRA